MVGDKVPIGLKPGVVRAFGPLPKGNGNSKKAGYEGGPWTLSELVFRDSVGKGCSCFALMQAGLTAFRR